MLKTMIILAVAYGLLAVIRMTPGSVLSPRRRLGPYLLLYGFASFGVLAGAGLVWLIIYVSQASESPAFVRSTSDPSLIAPISQTSDQDKGLVPVSLPDPKNFGLRTQPACILPHPGGPDLAKPSAPEWDFPGSGP